MRFLKGITKFVNEVKVEMKKVSWSDKNELIGSTTVVIFSTLLLALFIGIVDIIISKMIGVVLR